MLNGFFAIMASTTVRSSALIINHSAHLRCLWPGSNEITCGVMFSEIFTVCGKESINLAQRFLICMNCYKHINILNFHGLKL